jgi:cobalamin biosynthesis protein CbiG
MKCIFNLSDLKLCYQHGINAVAVIHFVIIKGKYVFVSKKQLRSCTGRNAGRILQVLNLGFIGIGCKLDVPDAARSLNIRQQLN